MNEQELFLQKELIKTLPMQDRRVDRFRQLDLVIKNWITVDGLYCEFGVATGRSINWMAKNYPSIMFHGFDSFEGLPEDWIENIAYKGKFAVDPATLKFEDNITIHKGMFQDTLPVFLKDSPYPMALVHIDCDIYSSTYYVLNTLNEQIVPGTVLVFDEMWGYPGWTKHEYQALNDWVVYHHREYEYISATWGAQAVVRITQ